MVARGSGVCWPKGRVQGQRCVGPKAGYKDKGALAQRQGTRTKVSWPKGRVQEQRCVGPKAGYKDKGALAQRQGTRTVWSTGSQFTLAFFL